MNKLIKSLVVALLLMVFGTATVLADDISGYKHEEDVRLIIGLGIMEGYDDGSFKPDEYITRAEVVTIVNRLLQRKADEDYVDKNQDKLIQFTDIVNRKYYWAYYDIYEAANNHHATTTEKKEEKWSHSWH